MKGLVKSGQQELLKAGTINGRRVVIIGFDLHQSDLPLRPAFPILMQNALSWLAPVKSTPIGTAYPGEPLTIPLTPGAEKRVLILPDGTAQAIEAEGTSFLYQVPEQVGNYHVVETSGDRTQNRYFSAQMRESESDITPRTVSLSAGQKTDINGKDADQLQLTGMNGYRDFTFWLIMLA
ncbi:hypothetical protein MXD63_37680, partial [Frankia sp. Cpl3]|nr:hypothetical protein [Frankia sp. Cpl3]